VLENFMGFKKVTAIIQCEVLEKVEMALQEAGVSGISVTYVKGYGDYSIFFKSPPLVTHARIEIFAEDTQVDSIVDTILTTAYTGMLGDGIVAVLPVEHFYRIRDHVELPST